MTLSFKQNFSFEKRLEESLRIRQKYPDRIPIICERMKTEKKIPNIDKNKYLVPSDLTIGQFMYVIKKRLQISHEIALFFIINQNMCSNTELLSTIYEKNKDADGFLYINYSGENTFGYLHH
jgi:GABA(A) receptor-associated protein